jgi:CheY-like chemotaxis protein
MHRPIQPRPRASDAPIVRVQIVEDLPRVQRLLKGLVEQPGRFEVSGIDDTEQSALERFMRERPDALVVDLNLREGSGLGLLNAVRQLLPPEQRPLMIVVTNHTLAALQAASIKAGADHFLDKSRELSHLAPILQRVYYPS